MGWDSSTAWNTKAKAKAYLDDSIKRSGWTIHDTKASRDGQWYLIERQGEMIIYLGLMKKGRGEYAIKTISESMGPYYFDCPLKWLDLAPVASQEWRDKVKELHQRKALKLEIGLTFELYGKRYKVDRYSEIRKRWMVKDESGMVWALRPGQVKDCRVIEEVAA